MRQRFYSRPTIGSSRLRRAILYFCSCNYFSLQTNRQSLSSLSLRPITTATTFIGSPLHHQQRHLRLQFRSRQRAAANRMVSASINTSTTTATTTSNNDHPTTSTAGSSSDRSSDASLTKDIWIIRHGQAMHNPRAEYAREVLKCTFDEFLQIMKEDDCYDAPLTDLGIQQAQRIYDSYGKRNWKTRISTSDNDDNVLPSSSSLSLESSLQTKDEGSIPQLAHNLSKNNKTFIELIVSSPLSRALQTAELAVGDTICSINIKNNDDDCDNVTRATFIGSSENNNFKISKRICYEGLREINGLLLNAKRRTREELQRLYPKWDFSSLDSNDDISWTKDVLETNESCKERGYNSLLYLYKERSERSILLVAHGGLLKYTLTDHPNIVLRDGRSCTITAPTTTIMTTNDATTNNTTTDPRSVFDRYHNCEIRRYRMELLSVSTVGSNDTTFSSSLSLNTTTKTTTTTVIDDTKQQPHRDTLVLTEVDL